jgi:hypothetical protein
LGRAERRQGEGQSGDQGKQQGGSTDPKKPHLAVQRPENEAVEDEDEDEEAEEEEEEDDDEEEDEAEEEEEVEVAEELEDDVAVGVAFFCSLAVCCFLKHTLHMLFCVGSLHSKSCETKVRQMRKRLDTNKDS